ncbi:NAD(P)H-dependent oxidoreductase [Liquorilactobacillus satsumensis]|uniref:NAD(P)H-dependent oxidoreductase n=1 Tax=Liquorilactobacillus satsumensis TaxID=259059 RepID=UPI001E5D79B5|nr:NAD(P)H-dependent oxidoreductase [Liquorilactobacillus satsumensis]MCC7666312.1 NADPH:quinone reductase [Liquorilactobacillus satsumensis]MCP9358417.1 NAD(P)H-dependent oxidoreductase [Liquorilactobacillus satsumensis]MCP9372371.1 NAD(P)H-dependent oxidoreductase [Liquorilactobacillus satsumensis]
MHITLVLDHPYMLESSENIPHKRSYSAAIAQNAIEMLQRSGHSVEVIDLQKDRYNPVLDRQGLLNWRTKEYVDTQSMNYLQRLRVADEIIFIFPLWWEIMPAMTKGFIDKVFCKGQVKKIAGKHLILDPKTKIRVLTACGTPQFIYSWHYRNPLGKMLKIGVFGKLGLKDFKLVNFNAEDQSEQKRMKNLKQLKKYLL